MFQYAFHKNKSERSKTRLKGFEILFYGPPEQKLVASDSGDDLRLFSVKFYIYLCDYSSLGARNKKCQSSGEQMKKNIFRICSPDIFWILWDVWEDVPIILQRSKISLARPGDRTLVLQHELSMSHLFSLSGTLVRVRSPGMAKLILPLCKMVETSSQTSRVSRRRLVN